SYGDDDHRVALVMERRVAEGVERIGDAPPRTRADLSYARVMRLDEVLPFRDGTPHARRRRCPLLRDFPDVDGSQVARAKAVGIELARAHGVVLARAPDGGKDQSR